MGAILPLELYEFLKGKNIKYLYFATTVKNACSMINGGTLMSNRKLNFQKIPMSEPNNSDVEKNVCVWNKLHFYTCDLHGYFTRQNKTGPVCFVVNIDFLLQVHKNDLSISKRNPLIWKKGLTKSQIYYSSVDEFSENFDSFIEKRSAHKNIILLRDKKSSVDLNKFLVEIIIDKPAQRHLLFTKAFKALKNALVNAKLTDIPLKARECKNFCFCQDNYNAMSTKEIEKLFNP